MWTDDTNNSKVQVKHVICHLNLFIKFAVTFTTDRIRNINSKCFAVIALRIPFYRVSVFIVQVSTCSIENNICMTSKTGSNLIKLCIFCLKFKGTKRSLNTLTEALHVTNQIADHFGPRNANKSVKALPVNTGSLTLIFAQVKLSTSFFVIV